MLLGYIRKTLSKPELYSLVIIVAFSFIAIFGLNLSMSMDSDGNMVDCPFMQGHMSLCPMSASEHISQWNSAFTAIPQNHLLQSLLAFISFIFTVFLLNNLFVTFRNVFATRHRRYLIDNPDIPLFSYFALLLAKGIIQPKLYA